MVYLFLYITVCIKNSSYDDLKIDFENNFLSQKRMDRKKRCNTCKKEKSVADFYKNKDSKEGTSNQCKECESSRRKQRRKDAAPSRTFPLLPFDINSRDWQNGKPFGGVSKLEKCYRVTYTIPDSTRKKTKSFSFKKTPDKEMCFLLAYNYLLRKSNKHGKTGNRIRMTDQGHLEVSLTQDRILLIDLEHLDLVQAYRISVTNKGYAQFYINSNQVTVQCLLTGYEVNDHDNRERLDCRMSNLIESSDLENNHNRGMTSANTSGIMGVSFRKNNGEYYWTAFFKYDNIEKTKAYGVKKHTYMGALEKALARRLEWISQRDSVNGLNPTTLDVIVNKEKLLATTDKYLAAMEKDGNENKIEEALLAKENILQAVEIGISIEKALPVVQNKVPILEVLKSE